MSAGDTIREEIKARWLEFSARFEGHTDYFYLDVKGLVTIGYGQLVDPLSSAAGLDFRMGTAKGGPADRVTIASAWWAVKAAQSLRQHGGAVFQHVPKNVVRATEDSIRRDLWRRLAGMAEAMQRLFPEWPDWPWQAQMAALSMCWALGAHFLAKWPKLTRALSARDWAACAGECQITETGNPGIIPRNAENKQLFLACVITSASGT